MLPFGCFSGNLSSVLYSAGSRTSLMAKLRSQYKILSIQPIASPSSPAHARSEQQVSRSSCSCVILSPLLRIRLCLYPHPRPHLSLCQPPCLQSHLSPL